MRKWRSSGGTTHKHSRIEAPIPAVHWPRAALNAAELAAQYPFTNFLILLNNFGPCPGSPCIWDVNGDGAVDHSDQIQVLANLGPCEGCPEDVNGNGVVDFGDVVDIATHFGTCP